jgi:hypothetical protein
LSGTCACVSGSFSPFDQVEAGDGFGHGVFDLQPRVHLHEPETVGFEPTRAVGDELDRAGTDVTGGLGGGHRGRAHDGAQRRAHARRRRLLDHLLVAALQRTVALVEMNGIAVAVGEYLHFDMARRGDVFFDQHALVAEGGLGLAHGARQRRVEVGATIDAAHALAAAAGHRLDQNRVADLVGLLLEKYRLLPIAVIARHHRHAGLVHQRLGAVLETHGAHRRRRRADKDDTGIGAGLGKAGVLRQEAVAGMDAAGLRGLGGGDQLVDDEIALGGRRWADGVSLVA